MKSQKILISKLRYHVRIPARLHRIRRMRIKRIHDLPLQHIIRRRIGPFHLTVYHTVDGQRVVRTLHLIMPRLLPEDLLLPVNIRMQHRIQIDVHQILEVLVVAARHRIHRLVRIRHGIQKGVQRALGQLNKRILHRKFVRPAEHRMFHDMRHARAVLRRRPESDIKHLILVIIRQKRHPGSRLIMSQQIADRI